MDINEAKQQLEQALTEVIEQYERFEQARNRAIKAFHTYFDFVGYPDELINKFNRVFSALEEVYGYYLED